MNTFKTAAVEACRKALEGRVSDLKENMQSLAEAATMDSKSTAGDKHETSRAMVQLEQERTGQQLKEAEQQLNEFLKIDFQKTISLVSPGSLVQTDKGCFLIAQALGKLQVEGQAVFVISIQAPLGKAFAGSKQKDTIAFNGVSYQMIAIS
jgi:transcription elongation GreA/GreB family factor